MIAVPHKFPLRTELAPFRARAQKLVTPHTIIYYLTSSSSARMAVIVPKKANKLATVRNSLKRTTYDTLWPLLKDRPLDCVVVYKPLSFQPTLTSYQELAHELTQIIGNL